MYKKCLMVALLIILQNVWVFSEEYKTRYLFKDNVVTGRYGYIDKTGKIVIKPSFKLAGEFINGMAIVYKTNSDEESGFINTKGDLVYATSSYLAVNGFTVYKLWDNVYDFNEDLARVIITTNYNKPDCIVLDYDNNKLHREFGYISKSGEIIIKAQYNYASDFKNGYAVVSYTKSNETNFVIIDKKNKRYDILPLYVKENNNEDNVHVGFFSDGLLAVKLANQKWGFIDIKGNIVIKPQYDCLDFEDSAFGVRKEISIPYFYKGNAFVKKSDKIFIINKQNEVLKEIDAAYLSKFSDDVAFTYNTEKQVTGAIDIDGNILFDNKENRTFGNFSDGLCWFSGEENEVDSEGVIKDGSKVLNKGYINKTGEIVLEVPQYESLGNFINGIAPVVKEYSGENEGGGKNENVIFIDKTGTVIFEQ